MTETTSERRAKPRQSLRLPIEVFLPGYDSFPGITRDISASGVYFYVGGDVPHPPQIDFIIAFPPEYTLSETCKVHCTADVVRIDRDSPSRTGIAASIRSYEIMGADISYPFTMVRTPNTR